MRVVIDLFHDDKLNKEFSRADNYINKRSFTLNADIEELKQHHFYHYLECQPTH